jgi:hypothetical protein
LYGEANETTSASVLRKTKFKKGLKEGLNEESGTAAFKLALAVFICLNIFSNIQTAPAS